MKKRFIPLFLLLAVVLTAAALAWTGEAAYAQGCTDPTGNPIPCPNPDKKTPTPVPPRATVTPTPTATAISTALPVANPTESSILDAKKAGCAVLPENMVNCVTEFVNKCGNAGGVSTTSNGEGGIVWIECSKDVFIVVPTPDPGNTLAIPTADGSTGGGTAWFCEHDPNNPQAKWACANGYVNKCVEGGGVATVSSRPSGIKVGCQLPDPARSGPIISDRGDGSGWDGVCTVGDETCLSELRATCDAEGGLYKEVGFEDTGAIFAHCTMPPSAHSGGTFPPGGWLPWITGFFGLLIGMLLPAVQKIRDAASRTARMPNNKNPDLMKSNEDQDPTAQKKAKRTEAEFSNKAEPTSQTREHVLLAKQDGEQGNSRPYRLFGDADGDSPPPPPPPPPQNNAPAEEEGMQLKAKRAEIAPQTREHILLANQPTDPSEAKSGSGGQKPPPPPPPPPPSGPTHTSVPISAGKPSLQDFHFSTMDPGENASLSGAKEQSDGIGGVRVASGDVDAAREQGDESAETGQPLKDRGSQLPPIGAGDGI